jgi:hypothetical protein
VNSTHLSAPPSGSAFSIHDLKPCSYLHPEVSPPSFIVQVLTFSDVPLRSEHPGRVEDLSLQLRVCGACHQDGGEDGRRRREMGHSGGGLQVSYGHMVRIAKTYAQLDRISDVKPFNRFLDELRFLRKSSCYRFRQPSLGSMLMSLEGVGVPVNELQDR